MNVLLQIYEIRSCLGSGGQAQVQKYVVSVRMFLLSWRYCFCLIIQSGEVEVYGSIACMRIFLDTFGVPEELSSDGGPECREGATTEFLEK